MGLISRYQDFVKGAGEVAGDYSQSIARQGLGKVCQLTNKYPITVRFNPFAQGLLKSYCPGIGAPPPQPFNDTPFEGGKCNIPYRVYGLYENKNVNYGGDRELLPWFSQLPINGAITQLIYGADGGGVVQVENSSGDRVLVDSDLGLVRMDGRDFGFTTVSAPVAYRDGVFITRVVPEPGFVDECPELDPPPPTEPSFDPSDLNFEVVFNGGDSTTVLNGTVSINSSSEFKNITDLELNIGGSTFNYDFDGFNNNSTSNFGGGGSGGGGGGSKFNPDDFDFEELDEFEELEKLPEEEEGLEAIKWVTVAIVSEPSEGKTILQSNQEDNDYFAGYFSWTIPEGGGAFRLPQEPVRKLFSAFKAPEGVSGFRIFAVNSATLKATVYREKTE